MDKYCVDCKYFVSDGSGTFQKCNRPGLGNNPVTGEPKTKLASFERIGYAVFGMDSCGPDGKYFNPKIKVQDTRLVSRKDRILRIVADWIFK